jgi:uncharacterized protein YdhG (YjbR/CyaY superfamily)
MESNAREAVPEAQEGTSYAMPALLYRGKGLLATARTKKSLSLYPYSGAVIASVLEALSDFGTTPRSRTTRTEATDCRTFSSSARRADSGRSERRAASLNRCAGPGRR